MLAPDKSLFFSDPCNIMLYTFKGVKSPVNLFNLSMLSGFGNHPQCSNFHFFPDADNNIELI